MPEVDDVVRAVLADTPRMTDESFAAGRERVLTKRRKPRQWLRIASVAAGVALVATAALFIPSSDTELAETATAASVLDRAASLVKDPDLTQTQYRYVKIQSNHPVQSGPSAVEPCDFSQPFPEETWIPLDPEAEWLYRSRTRVLAKDGDASRGKCTSTPVEMRRPHGAFPGASPVPPPGWTGLTLAQMADLSRDPKATYQKLSEYAARANSPVSGVFLYVSRGFVLPADMRATLLRALKQLPGITVTQESVTVDGRTGIAVGVPAQANDGTQEDIVINPKDGSLIAHRRFLGDRTITDVFTYGVADKIGEVPRG